MRSQHGGPSPPGLERCGKGREFSPSPKDSARTWSPAASTGLSPGPESASTLRSSSSLSPSMQQGELRQVSAVTEHCSVKSERFPSYVSTSSVRRWQSKNLVAFCILHSNTLPCHVPILYGKSIAFFILYREPWGQGQDTEISSRAPCSEQPGNSTYHLPNSVFSSPLGFSSG